MRKIVVLLMLLVQGSLVRAGENWPQFLGPDGNGPSDSVGLPLRWSETRERQVEDADSRPRLVVAGRLGQSGVDDDRHRGRQRAVRRVRRPRDGQGAARHHAVPQRQAAADRPDEQLRLADAGHRRGARVREFRLLRNRLPRHGDRRDGLEPPRHSLRSLASGRARRRLWPAIC